MYLPPSPSPRPLVISKANGIRTPPVSARPSSVTPKPSPHEPIRASAGPSIVKRPVSAARAVNRYINYQIKYSSNNLFYFLECQKKKNRLKLIDDQFHLLIKKMKLKNVVKNLLNKEKHEKNKSEKK